MASCECCDPYCWSDSARMYDKGMHDALWVNGRYIVVGFLEGLGEGILEAFKNGPSWNVAKEVGYGIGGAVFTGIVLDMGLWGMNKVRKGCCPNTCSDSDTSCHPGFVGGMKFGARAITFLAKMVILGLAASVTDNLFEGFTPNGAEIGIGIGAAGVVTLGELGYMCCRRSAEKSDHDASGEGDLLLKKNIQKV